MPHYAFSHTSEVCS